ncbi:30S ribosomal protein S3, partial [Propionibacterium freudenreichii]|nr:30S ribosomal protein S3 [Propionibacterium freudenreichii]
GERGGRRRADAAREQAPRSDAATSAPAAAPATENAGA